MTKRRNIESDFNIKPKKKSKKQLSVTENTIVPSDINDISNDAPLNVSDLKNEKNNSKTQHNKTEVDIQSLQEIKNCSSQRISKNDGKVNISLGSTSSDSEIENARTQHRYISNAKEQPNSLEREKPRNHNASLTTDLNTDTDEDNSMSELAAKDLSNSFIDIKHRNLAQPRTRTAKKSKKIKRKRDDSELESVTTTHQDLQEQTLNETPKIEDLNSSEVFTLNLSVIKENDLLCCDSLNTTAKSHINELPGNDISLNLSEKEFALDCDNKVSQKDLDLDKLKFGLVGKILAERRAQENAADAQQQEIKNQQINVLLRRQILKINTETDKEDDNLSYVPTICHQKLMNLLKDLENEQKLTSSEKQIKSCAKLMNRTVNSSWRSISFLVRAIKDSLLARQWNNVTRLLILLIKHYESKYAPYVRNLVDIIRLLHPSIQTSAYKEDLERIKDLQKKKYKKGVEHWSTTNIV